MRVFGWKWVAVAALVAVVSMSVAAAPQDRPRRVTHRWIQQFGMVTPANGQTLRLHVANLGLVPPPDADTPSELPPPDPDSPPDPCRVVLAFYDSAGRLIGKPIGRTLKSGEATFIDLGFEPQAENGFPPDPCRAAVGILQPGPRGQTPPDPCKATLEILDTRSGRVGVHMLPAVQHALPAVQ